MSERSRYRGSLTGIGSAALLSVICTGTLRAEAAAQSPPQGQAQAEGATVTELENIIVTAQRREEGVQETPLAISAVAGEILQRDQIAGVEALTSRLPNVSFSRNGGDAKIFIRGIGLDVIAPGSDPRVALYTDGVYNARTQAVLGSFYDLERIEVLRGPQGTLYGRNATAGAVNVISRDPKSFLEGYGTVTLGDYDLIRTEGAISGPLSSVASGRIAFQAQDRSGYGRHIENGEDVDDERTGAVRAKLRFDLSSTADLLIAGDYFKEDDHTGGYHFFRNTPGHTVFAATQGFAVPDDPRDYAGPGPDRTLESYGGSATASIAMGGAELTSITGYRNLSSSVLSNTDNSTGGLAPVTFAEDSEQVTQEIRLNQSIGSLQLILGGYYFHEKNEASTTAPLSGSFFGLGAALLQGVLFGGSQSTDAWAAFAQATINATDRLGIDLGFRYSSEDRRMDEYNQIDFTRLYSPANPPFVPGLATFRTAKASWSSSDPKVTLHYAVSDDAMAYVTYSQGFKSGGFNIGFLQPAFNPEKIKDYEVGIKADFFDHRLRTNLSAFYYDYTDLQVNVVEGIQLVTRNAAKAELYGAEAEVTAIPMENLRFDLGLAWLHSEFVRYDTVDGGRPELGVLNLAGNELSYAPEYKANAQIGYDIRTAAGVFTPRVNTEWVSRVYFSQFNLGYVSQPSRTVTDLYLDYEGRNGWAANLFVRNVTDRYYAVSATVSSDFLGYQVVGQSAPPRTYGVSVTKRF